MLRLTAGVVGRKGGRRNEEMLSGSSSRSFHHHAGPKATRTGDRPIRLYVDADVDLSHAPPS
jgi:hypothetical protein